MGLLCVVFRRQEQRTVRYFWAAWDFFVDMDVLRGLCLEKVC